MTLRIFSCFYNLSIYLFPYQSIEYYENNRIYNNTLLFYLYLYNRFFIKNETKRLYKISYRKYNKSFILNTNFNDIINNNIYDINNELNNEINKPRSLFIKYDIYINNYLIELNDKIKLKKYSENCLIEDVLKFERFTENYLIEDIFDINNIESELYPLKINKNNKEFKKYNYINNLYLKDIYQYL